MLNRNQEDQEDFEEFRRPGRPNFGEHKDIVKAIVNNSTYAPEGTRRELRRAEVTSQKFDVYRILLERAARICEEEGKMAGSDQAQTVFEEATRLAEDLTSPITIFGLLDFRRCERWKDETTTPEDVRRVLKLRAGTHPRLLVEESRKRHEDLIDREGFEAAVSDYIGAARFRDPRLDRLLFSVLAEIEITAFLREMVSDPLEFLRNRSGNSKYDQALETVKAINSWPDQAFIGFLRYGLLAALLFFIPWAFPAAPQGLMAFLAVLVMVIWFGLFLFMRSKIRSMKENPDLSAKRIVTLVELMSALYQVLHSSGSLSVPMLKEKLAELDAAGAVMPTPMRVLLEDIEARGTKSI